MARPLLHHPLPPVILFSRQAADGSWCFPATGPLLFVPFFRGCHRGTPGPLSGGRSVAIHTVVSVAGQGIPQRPLPANSVGSLEGRDPKGRDRLQWG